MEMPTDLHALILRSAAMLTRLSVELKNGAKPPADLLEEAYELAGPLFNRAPRIEARDFSEPEPQPPPAPGTDNRRFVDVFAIHHPAPVGEECLWYLCMEGHGLIDRDVSLDALYDRSDHAVAKALGLEPSDVWTRISATDNYDD